MIDHWLAVGLYNGISFPRELMTSVTLVDCVITKPSLGYETIQHMVWGGDSSDVRVRDFTAFTSFKSL